MPFTIVRQDITKIKVDAIVNAANTELQMGGGVCGAIFRAAGAQELQVACDKLGPIKTGEARITPGYALAAKYIIHAVGPVYKQLDAKHREKLLRDAYLNSLQIAASYKCKSIAFPLISSGIYGYPKDEALRVATSVIREFLYNHDIDIYLLVFDNESFVVSEKLLGEVASYIDEHYVEKHKSYRRELLDVDRNVLEEPELFQYNVPISLEKKSMLEAPVEGLDNIVGNLDEPFATTLLRLIDSKGKSDIEIYKRANLDRRLFSKIRTVKGYIPSKRTAIALTIALELNIEETDDLLKRAGYALSRSQKFDVIIEYFIIKGRYDIYEINQVLFEYDQPLLGG